MADVQNQSPRVTSGFLNTVNDPSPGVPLVSPSGSIVQSYGGQVGGDTYMSAADALKLSDVTNTGTLFEGIYKYVQFLSTSTAANARGQVVFWSNRSQYIVTPDATVANAGKIAGICLNAVTKGNWGFIQVAGKASLLFKAGLTTPYDGAVVTVDPTPSNLATTVVTDATAISAAMLRSMLGVADGIPASSTVSLVDLWRSFDNNW
jgi:hypothetical protein